MKIESLLLALILVLVPLAQMAPAQSQTDDTARIKADVTKRLAHKKNHVNLELRNGSKLKGRIEQADDNKFTIREDKTGNKIEFSYDYVTKVKGQGLGKGAKIAIVAVGAVVVVGVVVYLGIRNTDYFRGGLRIP
jgi:sRNA-binding regulator protein Hfq